MNASIRGIMFVKADRINQRIEKVIGAYSNMKRPTKEDTIQLLRGIQAMVNQELTQEGQKRLNST